MELQFNGPESCKYDGKVVAVKRLEEFSAEDWNMSKTEYDLLLEHNNMLAIINSTACMADKVLAIINSTACMADKVFNHDYYDIEFRDGYTIVAISGYHLELV